MDCSLVDWRPPEQTIRRQSTHHPRTDGPAAGQRQRPLWQRPLRRRKCLRQPQPRQGAVLAECALVLPVLLLFTLATLEFFQALLVTDLLQLATREAAREAALMTSSELGDSLTPAQLRAADEARIRAVVVRRLEAFGLAASSSADQPGGTAAGNESATAKSGWDEIVQVKVWVDDDGQASGVSPSRAPVGSSIGVTASLLYDEVAWLPGFRWLTGRTLTAASVLRRE